eukprot:TRINITY_DN18336_c0_g1_i2.p1 TRINITY_DN18336_c0_g1~~TRINITY_DN18336_c0_g1_i2.p1  ORF type:complete len:1009 (-),score=261.22 TRINITY_DN18336_c0_g1_i2:361-3387(-)
MTLRRTAVGIDLGTTDVLAANVGRKGVGIVQNGVSERRTPALVGFTDKRRLLGPAALAQVRSNFRNSCRDIKHVLNLEPGSPQLDVEQFWSFCPLDVAPDGDLGYKVSYLEEAKCFSAKVCLSMLLTSVVATCAEWTQMEIRDVVLAIPPYFSERARQACLDAVQIAGVQCLRLLHETTALAIAWRFDRMNFDDSKPIIVAFCSAGHSALSVAIARYEKGSLTMLGEAYDRTVAGREMDRMLMDMFAESLKKQGCPDPISSVKARLKLEEAATKVKKTLSSTDEARGTAESVIEDFDLSCDVKRPAFEKLLEPWTDKIQKVVSGALRAARLEESDLTYIEVVGGVSRVPFVQRTLRDAFGGRELSTTLNADEAVARGCAWQAAMLSSLIRLNQIPLQECGHQGVALEWEDSEKVEADGSKLVNGRQRLVIFEPREGPNSVVEVSMRCQGTLNLSAVYFSNADEPVDVGACIGSWSMKFPNKKLEDIEIHCCLDMNGIFSISKAMLCLGKKEEEEARAKAAKEEEEAQAKMVEEQAKAKQAAEEAKAKVIEEQLKAQEAEEEAAKAAEADENETSKEGEEGGEDAQAEGASQSKKGKKTKKQEKAKAAAAADAGVGDKGHAAKTNEKEAENKGDAQEEPEEVLFENVDAPKSRWSSFSWRFWTWGRGKGKEAATDGPVGGGPQTRKMGAAIASCKREPVDVALTQSTGFTKDDLLAAMRNEQTYRETDQAVVQAENSRNDYEAYIFAIRAKLSSNDEVMAFASPEEQTALREELDDAETWTYDHTEESASVYTERLKTLKKKELMYIARKTTMESIEEKVKTLKNDVRKYKACSIAPIYDHIEKQKLEAITAECDSITEWLADLDKKQQDKKKWDDPVFSVTELTFKQSTLTTNATKVLSEPRPKPAEPEKKKDAKKSEKSYSGEGEGGGETAQEAPKNGETVEEAEAVSPQKQSFLRRWMVPLGGGLLLVISAIAIYKYGEAFGVSLPRYFKSEGSVSDATEPAESDL